MFFNQVYPFSMLYRICQNIVEYAQLNYKNINVRVTIEFMDSNTYKMGVFPYL